MISVLLIPIGLLLFYVPISVCPLMGRILLLLSVGGSLFRGGKFHRVEKRWINLLVVFLCANALSTLFSADRVASLLDLARQCYAAVFSVLLAHSLRDASIRKRMAHGIFVVGLLSVVSVIGLYLKFGGAAGGDEMKAYKFAATSAVPNLALNFVAPIVAMSFFMGVALVTAERRHLRTIALPLFGVALLLTDARTTILAVLLAWLSLPLVRRLVTRPRMTVILVGTLVLAIVFSFAYGYSAPANMVDRLDHVTTHRSYLWAAAWNRFCDHPIVGGGADTWRMDLPVYLAPARQQWVTTSLLQLVSGAYHNAYLAFLAERGLVVFVPSVLMLIFLLSCALRLYDCRSYLSRMDGAFASIAPWAVIFLIIRQCGECSGLLSFVTGPADIISFMLASFVVAMLSECEAAVVVDEETGEPWSLWGQVAGTLPIIANSKG